jgi:hypothetical protein
MSMFAKNLSILPFPNLLDSKKSNLSLKIRRSLNLNNNKNIFHKNVIQHHRFHRLQNQSLQYNLIRRPNLFIYYNP